MAQNSATSDRSGEDGELVAVVGLITIIIFFAIIWFVFRAKIVNVVKWVYGLIATPFYVVSTKTDSQFASAVLCLAIAGIMLYFAFKGYKAKKPIDGKIGVTVVMLIWFITELVLPKSSSLLQAPIVYLCDPAQTDSLLPLLSCQRDTATVSFVELLFTSIAVGMLFGMKRVVEAVAGFFRIGTSHPDTKFKRVHTVDTFLDEIKVIEPHLRVFSDINLNLYDSDTGPLRNMDGTRRFCYREDLIESFRARQAKIDLKTADEKQLKTQNLNDASINENDLVPQVKEDRFIEVMTEQLGDVWVGVDNLSAGETIILAVTLPKVASYDENMSDKEFYAIQKQSEEIMEYMFDWTAIDQYKTYKDGEVDLGLEGFDKLDEYKAIIEKYIDHKEVQEVIKSHAYNRTILISMLTKARGLGILPPCEFRWLLLYDRTLWYTIQNVDRPSFACEGLGAISHWVMEVRLGVALPQPSFDVAFFGLSDQLAEFKYTKEDELHWKNYREEVKRQKRESAKIGINSDDIDELDKNLNDKLISKLMIETTDSARGANELYTEVIE